MTDTLPDAHMAGIDPHVYQRRWYILGAMCLSLVLVVATVSSVNVAIPTLATELKPTDTQILWIVDAYGLVFAGLLLFAGSLGDRFGRKGALLTGLVIFALASIACSQSTSPNVLIAMRTIMGVGAALIMPATLSLLTSVFPPAERPKAIATWAGFAGAGGAIGPVMGGAMLSHFWYGSVFFVAVPIAAIAFVMIFILAPNSKEQSATKLDPLGAVFSIIGLSALLFSIIEGPEKGWTSTEVVLGFVAAVLGIGAFLWWERTTNEPMLDLKFFRNARFSLSSIGVTCMFLAMFSTFFALSQYLQYVRGYSALKAGVATLPFAFAMIIVSPRSAKLAVRFSVKRVVTVGPLIAAIGLLLMSFIGESTPYFFLAVCLAITATGMAMTMPSFTGGIMQGVPMHKAGVGSAVNDTTRELGGAIGIAVVGSVITSVYRSHVASALDALPPEAAEQARRNVGRATGVAKQLAGQIGQDKADGFLHAVREAFVAGAHVGFRVSAAVAVFVALLLAWRFPKNTPVVGGAGH